MVGRKKKSEIESLKEKMIELEGKLTEQFEQGLNDLRAQSEEKVATIENQIESTASQLSELSKTLENRSVEIRTNVAKEFKHQLDEMITNLETLGLETNNEILDLSTMEAVGLFKEVTTSVTVTVSNSYHIIILNDAD